MSACFAFALQAGKPINDASLTAGTDKIWTGLPALVVVLLGGFTTNFIWCVLLNIKNRSGYQYLASHVREEHAHHGGLGSDKAASAASGTDADLKIPVLNNYLFSALAGTCWYLQFFFYTMGATKMGKYDFASWTLHMASIIIFSTIWGWIFHEWKGASKKSHRLIAAGIITLVLSTVIIGLGAGWSDFMAAIKSL
jgi:L-rhamnose-H+ transport protein